MAEEFYKVSPEEAQKLYKEYYDEHGIHRIIMAVNEQKDGTLLFPATEYEKIKDETEVKKIDFISKTKITAEQVDSKEEEKVIIKEPK